MKTKIIYETKHMLAAGRKWRVRSITTGTKSGPLTKQAIAHAIYQARHQMQGHQGWDARKAAMEAHLKGIRVEEICAESRLQGFNTPPYDAAYEIFNSWRQSPGHWSEANGKCECWGFAMARGLNGFWYGVGLLGHAR